MIANGIVAKLDGADEWRSIQWGSALYGERFDLVALDRQPRNEREWEWIEQFLYCRVVPGGRLLAPFVMRWADE